MARFFPLWDDASSVESYTLALFADTSRGQAAVLSLASLSCSSPSSVYDFVDDSPNFIAVHCDPRALLVAREVRRDRSGVMVVDFVQLRSLELRHVHAQPLTTYCMVWVAQSVDICTKRATKIVSKLVHGVLERGYVRASVM